MKKIFTITVLTLTAITTFAQGKVGFQTDSLHLVYWAASGQAVNDPTLAVDLYMGTASSTLFLYSTATWGLASSPGKWSPVSVILNANATTGAPQINTGTLTFVEIAVHSTERAAPNTFDPAVFQTFSVYGASAMFNFTPGSLVYPVLWNQTSGNWPIGTFNMDNSVYGAGARGAIALAPEPSAIALLGLGTAAVYFRRKSSRKNSAL